MGRHPGTPARVLVRRRPAMTKGRIIGLTIGLLGAVLGIAIAIASVLVFGKSATAFTFEETYPKALDDFGADARVLRIDVDDPDVTYELIGSDGRIHVRHYDRVNKSATIGSGTTFSRYVRNSTRPARAAERERARLRLGDLDENVVDDLFDRTDARKGIFVAELTGVHWKLQTDVFVKYEARYDGSAVRRTQTKDDVFSR